MRKVFARWLPTPSVSRQRLVHGHIRSLAKMHVDRIFMPSITSVQSENREKTSEWMCAIVKGYPLVIKNSDNPEHVFGIPFDDPLFHWYTTKDRDAQLTDYIKDTYHIPEKVIKEAIRFADMAEASFHEELSAAGEAILKQVTEENRYAVVLASRPYQNDPLVNHNLPEMFASLGIPVLTADAVPGVNDVDLANQPSGYRKQLPCENARLRCHRCRKPASGICPDRKLRLRA